MSRIARSSASVAVQPVGLPGEFRMKARAPSIIASRRSRSSRKPPSGWAIRSICSTIAPRRRAALGMLGQIGPCTTTRSPARTTAAMRDGDARHARGRHLDAAFRDRPGVQPRSGSRPGPPAAPAGRAHPDSGFHRPPAPGPRRSARGFRARLVGFAEAQEVDVRRGEGETRDLDDAGARNDGEVHRFAWHTRLPPGHPLHIFPRISARSPVTRRGRTTKPGCPRPARPQVTVTQS